MPRPPDATPPRRRSRVHCLGILCAALACGLACHQLGAARTAAPSRRVAAPPPDAPARGRRGADVSSPLPRRCGILFFYHVPSTGGAAINLWLKEYTARGNIPYFAHWGGSGGSCRRPGANGVGGPKNPEVQAAFVAGKAGWDARQPHRGGMGTFVQDLGGDEWRIAHAHHNSLHLNASEHLLARWRAAAEGQGCAFVAAVAFRGALGHALSLYKHADGCNSTREEWIAPLRAPSATGLWATQLDYFLYNFLARNPDGAGRDAKVRRALQLLRDHFDVVAAGDHAAFQREVLRRTGWKARNMTRTNAFSVDLTFTKSEVEGLHDLLEANGDVDFLHEVKARYREGV